MLYGKAGCALAADISPRWAQWVQHEPKSGWRFSWGVLHCVLHQDQDQVLHCMLRQVPAEDTSCSHTLIPGTECPVGQKTLVVRSSRQGAF